MKLNKFDREVILNKTKDLREKLENKSNLRRNYIRKDFRDAEKALNNATDENDKKDKELRLQATQSLINSLEIEMCLIDDNLEKLEKILINNEY